MFLYFAFNATRIKRAGILKAGSGLRSSRFGDLRGSFQKTAPLISLILFKQENVPDFRELTAQLSSLPSPSLNNFATSKKKKMVFFFPPDC